MAYLPDCTNPAVAALLPTLCSYPPEIQAAICERQPSLCVPVDYEPSIWEPVQATIEKAVEPFGKIYTAAGNVVTGAGAATLGVGQTILALPQLLTLGLIVAGIYFVTQGQRR